MKNRVTTLIICVCLLPIFETPQIWAGGDFLRPLAYEDRVPTSSDHRISKPPEKWREGYVLEDIETGEKSTITTIEGRGPKKIIFTDDDMSWSLDEARAVFRLAPKQQKRTHRRTPINSLSTTNLLYLMLKTEDEDEYAEAVKELEEKRRDKFTKYDLEATADFLKQFRSFFRRFSVDADTVIQDIETTGKFLWIVRLPMRLGQLLSIINHPYELKFDIARDGRGGRYGLLTIGKGHEEKDIGRYHTRVAYAFSDLSAFADTMGHVHPRGGTAEFSGEDKKGREHFILVYKFDGTIEISVRSEHEEDEQIYNNLADVTRELIKLGGL